MKDFVIVTDTCSDMYPELREKYNIEYIPMHIMFKGKDIPASLDWDLFSKRELWDEIATKVRLTTSQINEAEFTERFAKYIEDGKDVLYIACSSALSASVKSAGFAKKALKDKYPDANIICIDALNSCKGEGLMTIIASEMRAEGKTIEEVAEYIEKIKLKINQICTVDDLGYLKRAGRVTGASAFFGGILQVKPIIISDAKGQNAAITKVKGRKNSVRTMIEMLKESIENPQDQIIYIVHGDCPEDAENLANLIKEAVNPKGVYIDLLGPIIGSTTGPGTLAIYFIGKEVTYVKED